ncbi:MAG TPA: acyl-CoA dehydrogenase family protein, partial [Desulfatiglandales bacterium]
MNFDFGEKENTLLSNLSALFGREATESLKRLETRDIRQARESILEWIKRLGQAGYFDLGLEDGKNSVALVASRETVAAFAPSLFLSVEVSVRLVGRLIALYGTPHQKAELLSAVKEGGLIGAVGLSETGMNLEHPLETLAVSGKHDFLVSGEKCHVVNAPVAD